VDCCEWLYFGGLHGTRSRMLLGRIGQVRWADYPLSTGFSAFEKQADLRAFRAFGEGTDWSDEELVQSLAQLKPRPPSHRRFDLRLKMGGVLLERAEEHERDGETGRAHALYQSASALQVGHAAELQRRIALYLAASGQVREAAEICQAALIDAVGEEALALQRTGRRLSRVASTPWIPGIPLRKAPERELCLLWTGSGWGAKECTIEDEVRSALPGRQVVHGEGRLWTGLFVLLFYDLLWEPVSGMLPVPCLEGPLDLGRKGFVARRRVAFEKRLDLIREGRCMASLNRSLEAWGTRVRGLDWSLATPAQWRALLRSLPAGGLAEMMRLLGEQGFGAASGMPDLFLWPGAPLRLRNALPSRVHGRGLLVEVKGPTDSLRDPQRVWHDRLLQWGFAVEVWRVRPLESHHANHRRPIERAKAPIAERGRSAPHFRPGPGGTLFNTGPGSERVSGS
jgi:hypothetical protein